MQNVQNAAEIQQRVINLVELYRTKVGKESDIAKAAKADYEYWEKVSMEEFDETGISGGTYGEGPHTITWIKHLMVNEQLLGYFYKKLGREIEGFWKEYAKVGTYYGQMLPNEYDDSVFTPEEESFLASHFMELVNYVIQTPSDDLEYVHRSDNKNRLLIPEEVLALIESRTKIEESSIVYNPNTGFAQFATHFRQCKFICDDSHPWTRLALFANGVDAKIAERGCIPETYDVVMSFMDGVDDSINQAYAHLRDGGKMILLCSSSILHKEDIVRKDEKKLKKEQDAETFCARLVTDGSIVEIVQLPDVMSSDCNYKFSLIIVEKGHKGKTTMIDARYACKKSGRKDFSDVLDMEALAAMFQNGGNDTETGLRKMVTISKSDLKANLLMPQVYVIERPSEDEHPVPLSSLCSLVSAKVGDAQFDLPEDTSWITSSDITPLYTGDLDTSGIMKADCPNNPPYVKGKDVFNSDREFVLVDEFWGLPENAHHVWKYRKCTLLDGNTDAVLYEQSKEHGIHVAVVRATGKPYAVSKGIHVFRPKDGFDANSLAALLRLPIVYRQLIAYQGYGLGNHLDNILVPTDKRIISDELYRMKREETVTNELGDKVQAMKTEYINEVRMRKHDMGQKVFDLINTEDLMRYYVENRETETDVWSQIEEQLDHFRSTIHELSEMLDHLSQEEQFGTPELLDLNDYFSNLQHSNNVNGFTLSYQLDRDSILDVQLSRKKDKNIKEMSSVKATPTIYMAKNDLQRVVSNILTNAQKHGFLDSNRKDYEVNIRLEFNAEKGMYQIDFRNNGKPLPEGLNKMRYGIKGEKAGLTAGTGLGGSVVKSIVEHYKGDYDVFMDGEWTVIRIYLPIAI